VRYGLYPRTLVWASRLLMRGATWLLAARQAPWARAMQAELAAIGDEREAFAFARGCLRAALGHALAQAVACIARPHTAGVLGCSAAVLLGCLFMHGAGAPGRYVWMNVLSLGFAVATFWLLPRQRLQQDGLLRARLAFCLGALLLIASLGDAATAASTWLRVGPVRLNLLWLLLPALLMASDAGPRPTDRRWAMGGLLMAFTALALHADVVMAGLVAAFLGLRAGLHRNRGPALLALVPLAVALHAGPLWQAPAAAPFVDQVPQLALEHHPAIGLVLVLALTLPLWPALLHRRAHEHGCLWGLLVALSLPGWLPSPLVGFGGSFILGYLLSLALLPGDNTGRATTGQGPEAACRPRTPAHLPRSDLA
jgi:hypothetical protein